MFLPLTIFADRFLTGPVEAVSYTEKAGWPCYVAVTDKSSTSSNLFHASNSSHICAFALLYCLLELNVTMRTRPTSHSDEILTITKAGTRARFYRAQVDGW